MDRHQMIESTRHLVARARKGALATLYPGSGAPYASLVLVAPDRHGQPLFLMSRLAVHTRNIAADRRASLLLADARVDASAGSADTLTGSRVSLMGHIDVAADPEARARFLAAHPDAAGYADFGDFAFYRMTIDVAHLIEGFGRIVDIAGGDLVATSLDLRSSAPRP